MADDYDLVIIGGGPGGYNCAIRAAQLGMKTAVVEKRGTLGGTCLNVGCIPSKALLHASERYAEAAGGHMKAMGIEASARLDLAAMMTFKDKGVSGLTKGIEFLFKKNKIDWIAGRGAISGPGRVKVTGEEGERALAARSIVIATGSDVLGLPGVEIDEVRVVSSTGGIALREVPGRLLVVGAGYIGLELGSVWRRLGSEVTVVEYLDRITPGMDGEVAKQFQRILTRQGMSFRLGTKVTGIDRSGTALKVSVEPARGGAGETLEADIVLVAIGRKPYTEGLGLEAAGVTLDERGRIRVDDHYATTAAGIYAIGDVIAGPMLAHKAEDEGVALAELLAGRAGHVNYAVIPGVVYTDPEVATVGRTEEELKAAGIAYKVGRFPFTANSRAKTNDTTDGFVKILADAGTDAVLGVHMIGPNVGEMIAEACIVMEFGGSSEDIARTCHPHPTLTEAIRQAAMGVEGWTMQM
ncbi:MAG: dihydrolipoyl dehydrogenase [Alphaproteobacteria bacterium]|nr:dihydrolipoyl dehydrogenase [Alphaproteobacteria bacterium]